MTRPTYPVPPEPVANRKTQWKRLVSSMMEIWYQKGIRKGKALAYEDVAQVVATQLAHAKQYDDTRFMTDILKFIQDRHRTLYNETPAQEETNDA